MVYDHLTAKECSGNLPVQKLPVGIKSRLNWWENHGAEDKMAAKQMSMAEELLNPITPEPFTKILCLLHDSRATTIEAFNEK